LKQHVIGLHSFHLQLSILTTNQQQGLVGELATTTHIKSKFPYF
jgi:hypothetical protein